MNSIGSQFESQFDVGIVSVFGRGNWLASELSQKGLKVCLLDVSDQCGLWSPEDVEGPFGFFKDESLTASQVARMNEEEEPTLNPQGLTIWLPSGPFELKTSLTSHRMKVLGLKEDNVDVIAGEKNPKILDKASFDESWLTHIAGGLYSNIYWEHTDGAKNGLFQPLFASYYTRSVSRRSFEKCLQWCEGKGTVVARNARINDISIGDGGKVLAMQVSSDSLGIIRAEQYVWALSSEESNHLSPEIAKRLFPTGLTEPTWSWLRYRYKVSETQVREQLPNSTLVIQDIHLPWTHENCFFLQRTASKDLFDCWLRIPTEQRFNKQYLTQISQRTEELLKARLPATTVEIQDYPSEYNYTFKECGPTRFPVFSMQSKNHYRERVFRNLSFDNPENWKLLGWRGMFLHQEKILSRILDWKKKEDLKNQQKNEQKKEVSR